MSERREFFHFIDGAYRPSASGKTFPVAAPATGEIYAVAHEAGETEVDAAVSAARSALTGPWGALSIADRTDLLISVADEINARFDDFLEAEIIDTGKPRSLARHIDIPRGAANFKMFADTIRTVSGEVFEMATPDGAGAINYSLRKPRGVIAVICPWNFPLLLMTWKVGPALACGNTVVVKPSEETPATATLLGEVMNKAGVPKGVYNVVHGFGPGSAGELLTSHPGVDGVTFTGETRTGEAIMKAAGTGVRPVSLELGGKNPAIVFADADLDKAIEGTMRSVFANCGQVCLGTERVYVERPVFNEFAARLRAGAEKLKIGGPFGEGVSLGPLISAEHREKVLSYYKLAAEEGATVVTGGGVPAMSGSEKNGFFIEPTIWTELADESRVVVEEIFGPCCALLPFDEEDEVIARANNTYYGLAASLWTDNLARAHRVARQLDVGVCWVNSWFLRDLRTPFGGAKASGVGREGGVHSLEFYTELENICVKL
ncbi:2-hydroxymuconic semialdehyde dehydrogenase [Hyphococcus luteus]|uniref:2-hydroxymuconic semialdehyde dehydrogenase n=1 Tax=Hyphococcus luteus TaxID=2058213 RepID=A0A2S7K4E8_9PROT|nr:2-hydroxymuconic semialdehyde dehydrogenase [Marinicaulis flavus]PQA87377.1 2-hydroxymuconic semialdehyde dehydrogenase [Marinicaulis flavus]